MPNSKAEPPDILILAAGAGKRMKTGHPKALHPVFFRPMIHYVLDAAMAIPHGSVCLVVGRDEEQFREQCRAYPDLLIARQESPSGTADAVRAAGSMLGSTGSNVLILNADAVLLTSRSLKELLAMHSETEAGCTVGSGALGGADAAVYCFRSLDLSNALKLIGPRGAKAESSLEDAALALEASGVKTAKYLFFDPAETLDVNDQQGLWRAETFLQERINRELMLKGVALQDPRTTRIDPRCRIEPDVRIEGGCTIINSALEAGVLVENSCRIVDSEVGQGSVLRQGTCVEQSRIGGDCFVGPYARLWRGTKLEDGVRIGNYVEIANTKLGAGTRAEHLCFIEDAEIGRNVEIGVGFVTCNSSGKPLKQRTIIEDNVFIGGASQLIAPVKVGAGSFIATGTSVTEDVPPDAFVISRGRQVTKAGYAKKYGKPKSTPIPS